MPRYILDVNVDVRLVEGLRTAFGIEVEHAAQRGMSRMPDEEIAGIAEAEGLVVISHDQDFADIWQGATGSQLTVVHLRIKDQTVNSVTASLRQLFDAQEPIELRSALITVKSNSIRVRYRD